MANNFSPRLYIIFVVIFVFLLFQLSSLFTKNISPPNTSQNLDRQSRFELDFQFGKIRMDLDVCTSDRTHLELELEKQKQSSSSAEKVQQMHLSDLAKIEDLEQQLRESEKIAEVNRNLADDLNLKLRNTKTMYTMQIYKLKADLEEKRNAYNQCRLELGRERVPDTNNDVKFDEPLIHQNNSDTENLQNQDQVENKSDAINVGPDANQINQDDESKQSKKDKKKEKNKQKEHREKSEMELLRTLRKVRPPPEFPEIENREQIANEADHPVEGKRHSAKRNESKKIYETQCGSEWKESYKRLHKEILEGENDNGIIVFRSTKESGTIGEQLLGVMSATLWAVLNDKAIMIDWNHDNENIPLQLALLPNEVDWTYRPELLKNDPAVEYFSLNKRSLAWNNLKQNIGQKNQIHNINSYLVADIYADQKEQMKKLGLLEMPYYYAGGCMFHFLFRHHPSAKEAMKKLEAELQQNFIVALQTDAKYEKEASICAKKTIESFGKSVDPSQTRIVVTGYADQDKDKSLKNYQTIGSELETFFPRTRKTGITTTDKVLDQRQSFANEFFEHWLLSRSDTIVYSGDSSIAVTAALVGFLDIESSLVSSGKCNPKQSLQLVD